MIDKHLKEPLKASFKLKLLELGPLKDDLEACFSILIPVLQKTLIPVMLHEISRL